MDTNTAERVRTGTAEEPEYVDQTCWVPQGEEVIPAQIFLNGHAIALGKRFTSTESPFVDRLLATNRINGSHHHTALRLLHLFKLGTNKQDYAVMQIFMPSRGYDNSDFCPISLFIRVTRRLKMVHMFWVRVLCGLEHCEYGRLSQNADLLAEALERIDDAFCEYEEQLAEKERLVGKAKEYMEIDR